MHILLLTPAFPPMPGGGERYIGALARRLVECGQQVTVVTSAAVRESQFWDGALASEPVSAGQLNVFALPVRPFPGGRRGLMFYRKAMVVFSAAPGNHIRALMGMGRRVPRLVGIDDELSRVVSVAMPDLIHAFNVSWEAALIDAYAAARRLGLPLVVTPFAHLGVGFDDRVARNSTMQHQLAILGAAPFCQIHASQHLDPRHGGDAHIPRDGHDVIQHSIDPVTDAKPFLARFDMNIGGMCIDCALDDPVDHFNR